MCPSIQDAEAALLQNMIIWYIVFMLEDTDPAHVMNVLCVLYAAHILAGSIQDFLWQSPSTDMDVLPLPCHSSMMPAPGMFAAQQSSMPLASTVIALPTQCRIPPRNERTSQQHAGSSKVGCLTPEEIMFL